MKNKLALFLCLVSVCMCLAGCQLEHDTIEIHNKSDWIFDDVYIETKDGYFYESHEKFTVDENTIAVTIYFSTSEKDVWDDKSE